MTHKQVVLRMKGNTHATPPRVAVLIPAYNKEESIKKTLESIFSQTVQPWLILVVADNCTDNTVKTVERFIPNHPNLWVIESVDNYTKKSGALNQGFDFLARSCQDAALPQFLLQMDADTILYPDMVEQSLREFERDPRLGGICARYAPSDVDGKTNFWQRLMWKLQSIEYGLSDSYRVEILGKARVVSGAAGVFRFSALEKAREYQNGTVWDERSIIEDFRLTIVLKKLGYSVTTGMNMFCETDVPLGLRDLFKQRSRWNIGTFDEIRRERYIHPEVRWDTFGVVLGLFLTLALVLSVAAQATIAASGEPALSPWTLLFPAFYWVYLLPRLRFIVKSDWFQWTLVLSILPYLPYALFIRVTLIYSLCQSYLSPKRNW